MVGSQDHVKSVVVVSYTQAGWAVFSPSVSNAAARPRHTNPWMYQAAGRGQGIIFLVLRFQIILWQIYILSIIYISISLTSRYYIQNQILSLFCWDIPFVVTTKSKSSPRNITHNLATLQTGKIYQTKGGKITNCNTSQIMDIQCVKFIGRCKELFPVFRSELHPNELQLPYLKLFSIFPCSMLSAMSPPRHSSGCRG